MDTGEDPKLVISVPSWVDDVASSFDDLSTDEARMRLVIRLAQVNSEHGGGPFGAAVFLGPRLVAAGVNRVLDCGFSIAHAEVIALMRAQQLLPVGTPFATETQTLVTSTEPCCQCFGAIVWSDVKRLVCGAFTEDAEATGFDEGPKPNDWPARLEARGIEVVRGVEREEAKRVLTEYRERGGRIY